MYSDQLQFLNKIYNDTNTVDSLEPVQPGGEEAEQEEEPAAVFSEDTSLIQNQPSNQCQKTTRKHKKLDEVELKLLKALEPKTPCSKMAFLQSLMPHLTNFTDREFLQFQMGVLNVIDSINKMKETISTPQPNFSSPMPSYQLPSYQPPPVTQQQAYLPAHQPPQFSPQQYASTSFPTQISSNFDQPHSLSNYNTFGPPNRSKRAHKTSIARNKNAPPKIDTQQSTSQFLQGFCYSDSSLSESGPSPPPTSAARSTTPSCESTYSDFDFATINAETN